MIFITGRAPWARILEERLVLRRRVGDGDFPVEELRELAPRSTSSRLHRLQIKVSSWASKKGKPRIVVNATEYTL
jgi:hypothetical protein